MKTIKQVSLDNEVIKAIEKEAKKKGHTLASMLRHIVNQYAEKLKNS